ncbi:hypothetical protein HZC00_01695 [Candidatus Kaiserbacteria bacterium]|nr:hypothetical protein [Candidatus Kaiserbacteria bacterium]
MTTARTNIFFAPILGLALLMSSVSLVSAQAATVTRITDCSQNGQQPVAVGTRVASGTYVPVADQAVILNTSDIIHNTGILVYKECVLRPIIDAQRVAETSTTVNNGTRAFNTGKNGGPLIVQTRDKERLYLASDPEFLHILNNGTYDTVDPLFRDTTKNAIGQGYFRATRRSNDFVCPYTGLQAALSGSPQGSVQDALDALRDPRCNPYMATEYTYEDARARVQANVETYDAYLNWGQGVYPKIQLDPNGNYVVTDETVITAPGSIVRTLQEQLLTSGFRQQESANNVNEMVNQLFANVGTQVLSSTQGVSGLTQPTTGGTGASFLDQVTSQSGGQLTQVTGNAALQLLSAALAVERAYNQAVSAIAANLTQTIAQLRAVERQCWTSTIQNVCAAGTISADSSSCTGTSGANLTHIATSTAFSQAVITNNISPLASSTVTNLNKSDAAITQLTQFITTVSNNPGAQATVLAQYSQLSSQGAFHTQTDVTSAQSQQQTVIAATGNLVTNTINVWAGTDSQGGSTIPWDSSIYPGAGWCNYQNQQTLSLWDQRWR